MATRNIHGIDVTFEAGPAPAVRSASLSVIGVIGIAFRGTPNEPKLVRSRQEAVDAFGDAGPLPAALGAIYDQGRPLVVAVNLFDPASDRTQVEDEEVVLAAGAGELANQDLTGDIEVKSSDKSTTYVEGTHYTVDREAGTIALVDGAAAALASNASLKVTYYYVDLSKVTAADAIGSAAASSYTGMHAMLGAEAATGYRPRILCAPGFTAVQASAAAMLPVAERLGATLVADGPSTDDADAATYRQAFDSRRVFIVDPKVRVTAGLEWASPRVAGLIARVDADSGFWTSPSNHALRGVTGTERPVDYSSSPSARSNALNGQQIATIVRLDQGGFRLWGNRVPSSDSRWRFLSVSRTADAIEDALERSFLWALGRGLRASFFEEVSEAATAFLRDLQGRGAILGGSCQPADPALNSAAAVQEGKSYFDLEFTPVVPAEQVSFRVAISTERYAQLAGGQ